MTLYEDWAEKYRPRTIKNVVGNASVTKAVRRMIRNKNFPNMMLIGPPGTGKSTIVKLIPKTLDVDFIEINAASQSGINVVRDDIEPYARTLDMEGSPFKVVILDQVDRFSPDAQQASLQLAEEVSVYCKFLATTNYAGKLNEAFLSRFRVFQFVSISPDDMVPALMRICKSERIKAKKKDLRYIANAARGDLRQAVKALQTACEGESKLRSDIVREFNWVPPYKSIISSVEKAMKGEFTDSVKVLKNILALTQPKWFFLGLQDKLFYKRVFTEEERVLISLALPEGNPHAFAEQDAIIFLARLAGTVYEL